MEDKIISNLIKNEKYFKRVFSFLESDFFTEQRDLFNIIKKFVDLYKVQPSFDDLEFFIQNSNDIKENVFDKSAKILKELKETNYNFKEEPFIEETNKFIKMAALQNAIYKSAEIIENNGNKDLIPNIIQEAFRKDLTIQLGEDYFEDIKDRIDFYKKGTLFIPTKSEVIDNMLGGGFEPKSIYLFVGKQNIGKTLTLTSLACDLIKQGKNVLYISGEMSKEKIAMRIDANLLDFSIRDLKYWRSSGMKVEDFISRIDEVKMKNYGRLIIQDFPTKTTSTRKIETYMQELEVQKNFKADFIIVDYIGLFLSSTLNSSFLGQPYMYLESVLNEFRAIAIKNNNTVITAHQLNRSGAKGKVRSDTDDTDIADSYALLFTADFSSVLFQNPQLRSDNKIQMTVVKTRSGDNNNRVYSFDVDYDKMRLTGSQIQNIEDSIPLYMQEKGNSTENIGTIKKIIESIKPIKDFNTNEEIMKPKEPEEEIDF